jgi:serine/threonine-protein kinase
MLERARALLGPALSADDQRAFDVSVVDVNVKRMRILLPIMLAMHVAFIAIFRSSNHMDATPAMSMWRDQIVAVHQWTLLPVAALGLALLSLPRHSFARFYAPLSGLVYLVHAAGIVAADQLTLANMTVFIGYAFGIAIVLVLRPLAALLVYTGGVGAAYGVMIEMQPDEALRTGMLGSASMAAIVSAVMTSVIYAGRRREFAQRLTIERQRAELAATNETLEARVKERVHDIEVLNAALQAQVRERSDELSAALARLADRRSDDHAELAAGTVLGDRFEIESKLGAGGMGAVYAGIDRTSGAKVALKVINATSARQVSFMQRFLDEARVVATLTHPAIVRMIHVDVSSGGVLFQAQELVAGETLDAHLKRGSFTPAQSARIVSVLCDALASAHTRGIVHRDVKPSNMMLTTTAPGVKLLDFGIARSLARSEHHTGVDVVVGTPAYMAPEQKDAKEPTAAVDVWAAGVVLHRMLTGSLPSRDPPTVPPPTRAKRAGDAALADAAPPEPPSALMQLAAQCLDDDPTRRPSAAALAAKLTHFADDNGAPGAESIAHSATSAPHGSTVSMSPRRRPSDEARDPATEPTRTR